MVNVGILGYGYMGQIRKQYLDNCADCDVKVIYHTDHLKGDFIYCDNWIDVINNKYIFSNLCISLSLK